MKPLDGLFYSHAILTIDGASKMAITNLTIHDHWVSFDSDVGKRVIPRHRILEIKVPH